LGVQGQLYQTGDIHQQTLLWRGAVGRQWVGELVWQHYTNTAQRNRRQCCVTP
jgi:hypothetical protein